MFVICISHAFELTALCRAHFTVNYCDRIGQPATAATLLQQQHHCCSGISSSSSKNACKQQQQQQHPVTPCKADGQMQRQRILDFPLPLTKH